MSSATCAAAAAPSGFAPGLVLYSGSNLSGPALTIVADRSDLVSGLAAKSVAIEAGTWQLCSQANYRGVCARASTDIPDLAKVGLPKGVRSVRRLSGARPTPGQTGPNLKGMSSQFFPAPLAAGKRVAACPGGGSTAICVNQQAAEYCAALGYTEVRSVDVQTVGQAVYLVDLLCAKT